MTGHQNVTAHPRNYGEPVNGGACAATLVYHARWPDRTMFFPFPLEGPPKVGETTVVERLVKLLVGVGVPVCGFVTREVLGDDGRRIGFKVRDLAGPEAWLAHQDLDTGVRIGRFAPVPLPIGKQLFTFLR